MIDSRQAKEGFTLIEMMVVIMLIATVSLFALPKINNSLKVSINNVSREMATAAKETYNSAVLTGRVHRLVFDLKENQFWAESGPTTVLLDTQETREKEERRKKFARPDDKPPPSNFSLDKTITRKKVELPRGVVFEDVITEAKPEPLKEGTAYAHFFPHGVSERTLIHIKDEADHHVTLVLAPLTGRTRVIPRYIKGDDPDAQ